jgi:hypothetical protein
LIHEFDQLRDVFRTWELHPGLLVDYVVKAKYKAVMSWKVVEIGRYWHAGIKERQHMTDLVLPLAR